MDAYALTTERSHHTCLHPTNATYTKWKKLHLSDTNCPQQYKLRLTCANFNIYSQKLQSTQKLSFTDRNQTQLTQA